MDEPMNVTDIADPAQLTRDADAALERIGAARAEIGGVIFGQERVVDLTLATLLAGGHGLLIGVPGLAKTKLVETLGIVVGLDALRVQFTPDLMPSDILGSEVMEEGLDGKRVFRFIRGPIFAQLRILIETTGDRDTKPRPVMSAEDLLAAQRIVRRAPIGDRVVEAILDLVRAGRPGEGDPELAKGIGWGPGPRAAQALMLAARARALVDGRLSPSLDDIAILAEPALKHRMALTFAARAEGETISAVIGRLAAKTIQ